MFKVMDIENKPLQVIGGREKEQEAMDRKSNLILRDESGVALVVALLMMVILSLIGLASSSTSIFEIKLSGNKKGATEAFYMADAGIQMVMADITNFYTNNGHYNPILGDQASQENEFKTSKPELIGEKIDNKYTDPNYTLPTGVNLTDRPQVTIYHTTVKKPPRGLGVSATKFEFNDYIVDSTGRDQMDLGSVKANSEIREKIVRLIPTD